MVNNAINSQSKQNKDAEIFKHFLGKTDTLLESVGIQTSETNKVESKKHNTDIQENSEYHRLLKAVLIVGNTIVEMLENNDVKQMLTEERENALEIAEMYIEKAFTILKKSY